MNKDQIIERAHAHLAKREDLRWEHEKRREHNAMYPPKVEREVPNVVHKVQEDALLHEESMPQSELECIVELIGDEVGVMWRELESRIKRIEEHVGLGNVVLKANNHE
jgi:hypothetical protein